MYRCLVLLSLSILLSNPLQAGVGAKGREFQVNTSSIGYQVLPSVAALGSGAFVVVWKGASAGGSQYDILARVFKGDGTPSSAEVRVNTFEAGYFLGPAVAADGSHNFVVAWVGDAINGSGGGIFARRFDRTGAPLGYEFQVNTYTAGSQSRPAVAANASGRFVLVWNSFQDGSGTGVVGQRFESSGAPAGLEFQVNTHTSGAQMSPSVALSDSGEFVVVWTSDAQDGDGYGVFGQRFDSVGARAGSEFQINTKTSLDQASASVAIDPLGRFVVVWRSGPRPFGRTDLFGQRYDGFGSPLGPEFQISGPGPAYRFGPSVAADASGNFLVVWSSSPGDGWGSGVSARYFDSAGLSGSAEFQVNTQTVLDQGEPAVAADDSGGFDVAWVSENRGGVYSGIFGQILSGRAPTLTSPAQGTAVDCSSPLITRPEFTWDEEGFDAYRVEIAPTESFDPALTVQSGKTLLRRNSWRPSPRKWREACQIAVNTHPGLPKLFIRVFGVDRDLGKKDIARRLFGPILAVNATW